MGKNFALIIVLICLMISLAFKPQFGQAANNSIELKLNPNSTILALLDKRNVLTDPANRELFQSAGFKIAIIENCQANESQKCLLSSLKELKESTNDVSVILLSSGVHTEAVYRLYQNKKFQTIVSGVILLRAEPIFKKKPLIKKSLLDLKTGPPLLVITKEQDKKNVVEACRHFTDHMRAAGIWSWFIILPKGNPPSTSEPPVITIIKEFIGAGKQGEHMYDFLSAVKNWQQPPLNNDRFYDRRDLIGTYPINRYFMELMKVYFRRFQPEVNQWAFKTYQGFDILKYKDQNPVTKDATFLVLRNKLGHFYSIDLKVYTQYKPIIVIGIDYEKNLFRFASFYRNKARYSWIKESESPKFSVNPLGAFVTFLNPPPVELEIPLQFRSKLTLESITFSNENPLDKIEQFPQALQKTLIQHNKCINCHSLDGVGGRAHHIVVKTGEIQEGYGLPLRSYSKEVLKTFLYDQKRIAEVIGATPNPVSKNDADLLFDYLTSK